MDILDENELTARMIEACVNIEQPSGNVIKASGGFSSFAIYVTWVSMFNGTGSDYRHQIIFRVKLSLFWLLY